MCLGLILGTVAYMPAQAADEPTASDDVEVIEVRGIRGSQAKAVSIKRDSSGVVDAISAEDIGKMPDTNLAESLQRISGVSIDRVSGEGSKVTVRGFGPDFNMVTLNGRVMPTSSITDLGTSTRSFDFANIASESVSGIEVSKTGKANMASGGIGSSINIDTARPFDKPGLVATAGLKANYETDVDDGDDITPEMFAILGNTWKDDTLGVLFTGNYKKRDATRDYASIDGWRQFTFENGYTNPTANVVDENENPYGNYFYARNIGYGIENLERERYNAQLSLQYAPADEVVITTDYTYSKLTDDFDTDTFGLWFNGPDSITDAHINKNGTFDRVTEVGGDYSSTMRTGSSENENKSFGINMDWQATSNLQLNIDYHDSQATSKGNEDDGSQTTFFILGGLNVADKTYDASGTEIPLLSFTPAVLNSEITPEQHPHILPEQYASLFAGVIAAENETDVTQLQLNGTWVNDSMDSLAEINFGIGYLDVETNAKSSYSGAINNNCWYCDAGQGVWADDLSYVGLGDFLDDFSGGGGDLGIPYYYDYDQHAVMQKYEELRGLQIGPSPWDNDHTIEEETISAYLQFKIESEFNDMPLNILAGMRYESTDVDASSLQNPATRLVWQFPTEWATEFNRDVFEATKESHSYEEYLPSLDISLEPVDDVVARFSYSRTITRPTLGDMRAAKLLTPQPKVGSRTGSAGNPGLKPFSSDNIDFSVEYYYGDASYVSVGWFNKEVENFLATRIFDEQFDHLRDPYLGPAAEQARAEIIAAGGTPGDEAVFEWLIANGYGDENGQIPQSDLDPVADWDIKKPDNVEDLNINGWEIAVQHWFWDTGFGVSANYTDVSGDVEYDVEKTDEQFALPGLSDTFNFSFFYEKDGLQARLAYNWRDDFLSGLGQAEAGGPAPQFTEDYGQLDAAVSYEFTENLVVAFEGINITEEEKRIHGRYQEQMLLAQENSARYSLGVRYSW
jgi:TonB-dependent receptor